VSRRFEDHFSTQADAYAAFRPSYPGELFAWLAGRCARRELAWDCATGNGQAAEGLARWFRRVVATDASPAQIANARPVPGVEYRVALADGSGLEPGSADLVTVAQAMHWIDRPSFYREVNRVARPGAVLAIWTYALARIEPAIDAVVEEFERERVGRYWPPERALVDQGYRTIDFPFPELEPPRFVMVAEWTLARFAGYLGSWSAVDRYRKARGEDPVALVRPALARLWGDPERPRRVEWPLSLRAGLVGRAAAAAPPPNP
jgi:SAM-dependent methyltransferase